RAGGPPQATGRDRGRSTPEGRHLDPDQGSARRMTWWAVHARPAADDRERVAAWLVARTGHAVEERADGVVVAFAGGESDAIALAQEASAGQGAPATAQPVD